jgi:CRISPR/Cas system-associated protein endoribonuclease Cas2
VAMVRARAAAKKKTTSKKVATKKMDSHKDNKSHNVNIRVLSGVKKINNMKSSMQIFWTFFVPIKGKFSKSNQIKINKFLGSTGIIEQKMYPLSLNANGILFTFSNKADLYINQLQGNNPLKKSMVVYKCTDKQFSLASSKKGDIPFGFNNYITLTAMQKQAAKYIN